jgi:hypothetical protein
MPTRKEISDQIAALQAELEGTDDDYEVWVKDEKGNQTKVPQQHAKGWLQKLGILDPDEPAGDESEEEEETPDPNPPKGGYFKGKK